MFLPLWKIMLISHTFTKSLYILRLLSFCCVSLTFTGLSFVNFVFDKYCFMEVGGISFVFFFT